MESEHWYVVYTRFNTEKKLHALLEDAGYTTFLPLYSTLRQWSDRKKKVHLPLIRSVIFVKTERKKLNELYQFTYVQGILKEHGRPGTVRQQEINNLSIIAQEWSGEKVKTNKNISLESGDPVKVSRGPFEGVYGELIEIKGKHRVVVKLQSMRVEFVIDVPKNAVIKEKAQ